MTRKADQQIRKYRQLQAQARKSEAQAESARILNKKAQAVKHLRDAKQLRAAAKIIERELGTKISD